VAVGCACLDEWLVLVVEDKEQSLHAFTQIEGLCRNLGVGHVVEETGFNVTSSQLEHVVVADRVGHQVNVRRKLVGSKLWKHGGVGEAALWQVVNSTVNEPLEGVFSQVIVDNGVVVRQEHGISGPGGFQQVQLADSHGGNGAQVLGRRGRGGTEGGLGAVTSEIKRCGC